MYMAVFYVVFGLLFQRGGGGDFIPFLLCGLTAWKWFASCVDAGSNAIKSNGSLMGQVHIPKIIFPGTVILQNTFKFFFVFCILLIFMQFYRPGIDIVYLILPLVLIVQFLFICAIAFLLGAIVPFLPDLVYLIRNALQALFFLSGIFYSVADFPGPYQKYFYINPMVTVIDSYRSILIRSEAPNFVSLIWIGSISAITIIVAFHIVKRFDRVYPKII